MALALALIQTLTLVQTLDPTLILTPDESIECLTSCVEFGMAQAKEACNLDCTILIGNTGAGKSTFANYIHGCQMQEVKKEDIDDRHRGREWVIRVKPDSLPSEIMAIGHQKMSMTFVPEVKRTDAWGTDEAIVDCPGFGDNRCVVRCIDRTRPHTSHSINLPGEQK